MESASITITDEIFEYWQQNRQLKVEFDLSQADPNNPAEGKILHVRIENARHRVTVSFDERSKGFVWFFSFLSYFSHLEETEKSDLVILLDEPGTALHAMAQKDFLRFMDERLAEQCQVIYTTHSPFMVDLNKLQRVRTVQDMDGRGTVVSHDAVENDSETVFPLQMAMGYQMAQTLFLAPHCLMVNSAADLIYLQVLGGMVVETSGSRIDPRWVVIPVGSAENLPTFVSLLGDNYVSVAVMMDITPTNKERVERINKEKNSKEENSLKCVEVTRVRDADIEDLFDSGVYLDLVNKAYKGELHDPITMKMITGFIKPTEGKIKIKGMDVEVNPIECKKLIGYLPEGAPLYGDMTPLNMLKFVAKTRGINDFVSIHDCWLVPEKVDIKGEVVDGKEILIEAIESANNRWYEGLGTVFEELEDHLQASENPKHLEIIRTAHDKWKARKGTGHPPRFRWSDEGFDERYQEGYEDGYDEASDED